MNTNDTNTELELVPAQQPGEMMKRADLPVIWEGYATQAEKLKATAETLTVTSIEQVTEMKLARATRLALKNLRVEIEHKRKELVEDMTKQTAAINGEARKLKAIIEPLEERLEDQENFIARETLRIEDENRTSRHSEISPFLMGPLSLDLGKMSTEDFAKMLADAKDLAALREERIRKEKEAAEAKAKAEAEERERIRLENEELKRQAEEREAAAKAEREEAARLAAEAKAKSDAELAAAQDKAREEAIAAQKARESERAAFEAEVEKQRAAQVAALAKAKKEREAIEEKARAEKEAAEERTRKEIEFERKKAKDEQDRRDAKAKSEKEAADKENARLAGIAEAERQKAATAAREAKEAREKSELEEAARKASEEKAESDRLASIEAARLAPEKDKLLAFAKSVLNLVVPEMETEKGQSAASDIESQIVKFAAYVEKKAGAL